MSQPFLIQNGTLLLPDGLVDSGSVLCDRGAIVAVGDVVRAPKNAVVVDARGGFISPGFVDIHVHGGAGADFMDGTAEAVRTVLKAHARHGDHDRLAAARPQGADVSPGRSQSALAPPQRADYFFVDGQIRMKPSVPPLAIAWPSGEKASVVTVPVWALIVDNSLPAASQILIV